LREGYVVLLPVFNRVKSLKARFEFGYGATYSYLAQSRNDARHQVIGDGAIGTNRFDRKLSEESFHFGFSEIFWR
jgi:hypothetical protein